MKKKIIALLLAAMMILTITACESTDTPPATNPPADNQEANPAEENSAGENEDNISEGETPAEEEVAIELPPVDVKEVIDLGFYVAKSGEFEIIEMGQALLHRDIGGDGDVGLMHIPLEQRSMEIWGEIETMLISFVITDVGGGAAAEEIWWQFYFQQPNNDDVVGDINKRNWNVSAATDDDLKGGELIFGQEYVYVLDIAKHYREDRNFMGSIGLQIGNHDFDPVTFHIGFTDVQFGKYGDFDDVVTWPMIRPEPEN